MNLAFFYNSIELFLTRVKNNSIAVALLKILNLVVFQKDRLNLRLNSFVYVHLGLRALGWSILTPLFIINRFDMN